MYAEKTLSLRDKDNKKLGDYLRTIVEVTCINHIKMNHIRNDQMTIINIIQKKISNWFGHVVRKDNANDINYSLLNDFNNRKSSKR